MDDGWVDRRAIHSTDKERASEEESLFFPCSVQFVPGQASKQPSLARSCLPCTVIPRSPPPSFPSFPSSVGPEESDKRDEGGGSAYIYIRECIRKTSAPVAEERSTVGNQASAIANQLSTPEQQGRKK